MCLQSSTITFSSHSEQQGGSGKDYGIHLMHTPLTEESPEEEGAEDKKKTPPVTLETLEDFMITTHAKQVLR